VNKVVWQGTLWLYFRINIFNCTFLIVFCSRPRLCGQAALLLLIIVFAKNNCKTGFNRSGNVIVHIIAPASKILAVLVPVAAAGKKAGAAEAGAGHKAAFCSFPAFCSFLPATLIKLKHREFCSCWIVKKCRLQCYLQ
jgi:hypothetical protein